VVRITALLALAGVTAAAATASPLVSTLSLPSGVQVDSVEAAGERLLLSGWDTTGNRCVQLIVDAQKLRVAVSLHASCERPPIAAHSVVPVQFPLATGNESSVRIARPNRVPGRVSYGPVVMTFNDVSDTKLEWTYGPGRLWLYDVAALHGTAGPAHAEALAVSTTTGRVVQTASMPSLVRPLLAADADGLWIAASPGTGAGSPAPTYLFASGAHAPRLVHRGGYAAFWLAASGHTVWEDIASIARQGSAARQEIWRYGTPTAAPTALARADNLEVVTPAVQPGSGALWTLGSPPSGGCFEEQVVKIDAHSGRQTIITTFHLPGSPCSPEPGNGSLPYGGNSQVFADGAFYFLTQGATRTLVHRVQP
jgi:hypothetical protein